MTRVEYQTTIDGQNAVVIVPPGLSGLTPMPLVIYCHGAGDDALSATHGPSHEDIYTALAAEGILVGAVTSTGVGNDENLAGIYGFYEWICENWTVSSVAFMAQSMGGVVSQLALTGLGGTYPDLKGFLGIYPVSNLAVFYENPTYETAINAAYDIPGGGNYATQTAGHDPVLIDADEYPNIRYRYYGSEADGTVPADDHAELMVDKLADTDTVELEFVETIGVHGDPSNFRAAEMVAFFLRCFDD